MSGLIMTMGSWVTLGKILQVKVAFSISALYEIRPFALMPFVIKISTIFVVWIFMYQKY